MRKLIHIDMDAFFASVEQRDNPELRGKPVVVGGNPQGRGVVAAASYEARRYGIHSAMPAARALRLCPQVIFVKPVHGRYSAVSKQMRAILADYTDEVEPTSVDECYLDVTTNKVGLPSATAVAVAIRRRIHSELSLTASAGVASVRFVAKIASDWNKPDGLTVVPPQRLLAFLQPLPVGKLPGVGPATRERIHKKLGVYTVGELAELSEQSLVDALGKHGRWLHAVSHGDDPRGISTGRERKSRGSERTFATDLRSRDQVVEALRKQVPRVCSEVPARRVTLKIRYSDFETVTRATTLPFPTSDPDTVLGALLGLLDRTAVGERPVRLAGVSLGQFAHSKPGSQMWLPLSA